MAMQTAEMDRSGPGTIKAEVKGKSEEMEKPDILIDLSD
jgi:hypothetical protein